jgi:hypothetical protein
MIIKSKYIHIIIISILLIINGCTGDNNKNFGKVENLELIKKPNRVKLIFGDTLFLGFRENMPPNLVYQIAKRLVNEKKLESYNSEYYYFIFLHNGEEFRMPIDFYSHGEIIVLGDTNKNELLLDEIILSETECYDLVDSYGKHELRGECFEEKFRKTLLEIYSSKYEFNKIEKPAYNEQILRFYNDEEKKIRRKKYPGKPLGWKTINLPNGKHILYINKEKGVSIKCYFGYSEHNTKTIQFKKIEIRYLSKNRLDAQIEEFTEYIKQEKENKKLKTEMERKKKEKEKEIIRDI